MLSLSLLLAVKVNVYDHNILDAPKYENILGARPEFFWSVRSGHTACLRSVFTGKKLIFEGFG